MKVALLTLLLACGLGAVPLVQSAQGGDNSGSTFTSVALAYGSNNASGNLLVVACAFYNASAFTMSVTDSAGNSYASTAAASMSDGSGSLRIQIFYAVYSKVGANTVTCHYSSASANLGILIHEFAGYSVLDQTTSATGTGTAIASGSVTTNFNPELLFGLNASEAEPPASTPTGGYTNIIESTTFGLDSQYLVQSTKGAQNATATTGASAVWVAIIATFKANNTAPPGVL